MQRRSTRASTPRWLAAMSRPREQIGRGTVVSHCVGLAAGVRRRGNRQPDRSARAGRRAQSGACGGGPKRASADAGVCRRKARVRPDERLDPDRFSVPRAGLRPRSCPGRFRVSPGAGALRRDAGNDVGDADFGGKCPGMAAASRWWPSGKSGRSAAWKTMPRDWSRCRSRSATGLSSHKVEPRLAMGQWGALKPGEPRQQLAAGFIEKSKAVRQYLWREILGRDRRPLFAAESSLAPVPGRSQVDGLRGGAGCFPRRVWPGACSSCPRRSRRAKNVPWWWCSPASRCVPQDALERNQVGTWGVAAQLADRGFVVFVPQNLYRGGDDFRRLDKEARAIKASMWSFMIAQHDRILDWLGALPYVDAARIGFYGCSYGGTTAVYVPPILEKYCLSICSANFNDWTRMIASTTWKPGYMGAQQWEFCFLQHGKHVQPRGNGLPDGAPAIHGGTWHVRRRRL